MRHGKLARRWAGMVVLAGMAAGGALLAPSVPADTVTPVDFGDVPAAEPRLLLSQAFPPGGTQFGGPGRGPGMGAPRGMAQGFQGGAFPSSGRFGMEPGQTIQLAAFCTELLADPPNGNTRFTGGDQALVLAAGAPQPLTLARAMSSGLVALRGRENSFDPERRDGSLMLDLYLANVSDVPVQVNVQAGTTVTPAGQSAQPLPPGAERLFAAAARKRLTYSNTLQYAVWAARGNTAEEVEQTQMVRLTADEREKVQTLLETSGIETEFDRERGRYAAMFQEGVKELQEKGEPVRGVAVFGTDSQVQVEGVRGPDDKGLVKLQSAKRGPFYCRAEYTDRKDGKVNVRLSHLATGRPVRLRRTELLLHPSRS